MAKFCNAEVSKGQCCKNCRWFQIDEEESEFYGMTRYSCFAKPDVHGNVKWAERTCNNCGYKFTSSMFNGDACGRTNDFLPEDRCCCGWKPKELC